MMKNYKFLILLAALLGPFAYFVFNNEKIENKIVRKKITPVDRKISSHPPKIYTLPKKKEEKAVPRIYGRKIMGPKLKKLPKNLKMVNKYNPQWKNNLTSYLLKFQNPKVNVDVNLHEAFVLVKKGQGRFVEEVVINYTEKGEHISSFRAIVDSEDGRILTTFDKITIQERRNPYPRLKPTGSIRNPPARRTKEEN